VILSLSKKDQTKTKILLFRNTKQNSLHSTLMYSYTLLYNQQQQFNLKQHPCTSHSFAHTTCLFTAHECCLYWLVSFFVLYMKILYFSHSHWKIASKKFETSSLLFSLMFQTCRRCSFMLKWCWNSIKSLDFSRFCSAKKKFPFD
jgi:hypothetical protein